MNSKIIGVGACLVIALSAVYGALVFAQTNPFGLTAATVQSQLQDNSRTVAEKTLTGRDLFGIAQQFNLKIEKGAASLLVKDEKNKDEKTEDVKVEGIKTEVVNNLSIKSIESVNLSSKGLVVPTVVGDVKAVPETKIDSAEVAPIDIETETSVDAETENGVELTDLVAHRRSIMKQLAKTDPKLFLAAVLPTEKKDKLSDSLQAEVELSKTLTGTVEAYVFDDFANAENSHYKYFLNVGSRKYDFYPTETIEAISGDSLRVQGVLIDDVLVASRENITRVSSGYRPRSVGPIGEQKTLIVLISFQDSLPTELQLSKEQVQDRFFNPNQKFQSFFAEQSYGKISFSGDVTDWITLPRNCNAQWPDLGQLGTGTELRDVFTQYNIPFDQYDRLMVLVNLCSGTGYSGYSSIGPVPVTVGSVTHQMSTSWVNMIPGATNDPNEPYSLGQFMVVAAHEMGHGLGLYHATGLDCDSNIFTNNCLTYGYGNYFDVMGGGGGGISYANHFNALSKELLGWVSPQNRLVITTSGRYTLNSFENTFENGGQNTAKNFAKIKNPVSNATPFYLEYRNGFGFDGKLNEPLLSPNRTGLMVNYTRGDQTAVLLDMEPTSAPWNIDLYDASLTGNSTYTNPETGITIGPIVATTTDAITFDVSIVTPPCVRRAPEIETDPMRTVAAQGYDAQILFSIYNADSPSCSPSSFGFETFMTNVWRPVVESIGNEVVQPGMAVNKVVNFRVPTNTPVGSYVIKNRITKTSTNAISYPAEVKVVPPPTIDAVTPRAAHIGEEVALRGRNLTSAPLVFLTGEDTFYYVEPSLSDESEYRFTMPTQMRKFEGSMLVRTKPGKYSLTIITSDNIVSAPVSLEILR